MPAPATRIPAAAVARLSPALAGTLRFLGAAPAATVAAGASAKSPR